MCLFAPFSDSLALAGCKFRISSIQPFYTSLVFGAIFALFKQLCMTAKLDENYVFFSYLIDKQEITAYMAFAVA